MNPGLILAVASLLLMAGAVAWTNVSGRPLPPTAERAIAFAGLLLSAVALLAHPGAAGYVIAGIACVVC